jgi:hypothetical protein
MPGRLGTLITLCRILEQLELLKALSGIWKSRLGLYSYALVLQGSSHTYVRAWFRKRTSHGITATQLGKEHMTSRRAF